MNEEGSHRFSLCRFSFQASDFLHVAIVLWDVVQKDGRIDGNVAGQAIPFFSFSQEFLSQVLVRMSLVTKALRRSISIAMARAKPLALLR